MTLEGHTSYRSVGRIQPRWQVAGFDRVRTRSDPLGRGIRQARAHLEGASGTWAREFASARTAAGSPPRHSHERRDVDVGDLGRRHRQADHAGRLGRWFVHVHARRQEADFCGRVGLVGRGSGGCSSGTSSTRRWSERPKTAFCRRRLRHRRIESRRQRHRAGGLGLSSGQEKGKPVIVLWGMAEDRPLYRLDQSAEHLAFSPDGRTLLGVGRDGNALVWDPRNGTLRETIRVCEAGHFAIRDIAVAPDSRHFAAAMGNGTARIFRLQPAPETVEPREPLPVVAARLDPPGDLWKQLIDKPAPELRAIKAWAGGPPVRLADLRGKFVLLHFWGSSERISDGRAHGAAREIRRPGIGHHRRPARPGRHLGREVAGPRPSTARNGAIAPCPSGSPSMAADRPRLRGPTRRARPTYAAFGMQVNRQGRQLPADQPVDRPRRHGARRAFDCPLEPRARAGGADGRQGKGAPLAPPIRPDSTRSPTARSSNASGRRILPSGPITCSITRAAGSLMPSAARSSTGTGSCAIGGPWGSTDLENVLDFVLKLAARRIRRAGRADQSARPGRLDRP